MPGVRIGKAVAQPPGRMHARLRGRRTPGRPKRISRSCRVQRGTVRPGNPGSSNSSYFTRESACPPAGSPRPSAPCPGTAAPPPEPAAPSIFMVLQQRGLPLLRPGRTPSCFRSAHHRPWHRRRLAAQPIHHLAQALQRPGTTRLGCGRGQAGLRVQGFEPSSSIMRNGDSSCESEGSGGEAMGDVAEPDCRS